MPSKPCYIFDLDGTIADDSHRVHYMKAGDWNSYFAACSHDPVIAHVAQLGFALHAFGFGIIIVTGRSETVRAETEAWLAQHFCPVERLYMRAKGDFRPNSEMKLAALANLRAAGYEPLMALDDQPQTCAMWRNAGVPCAQVKGTDEFVEYRRQA